MAWDIVASALGASGLTVFAALGNAWLAPNFRYTVSV